MCVGTAVVGPLMGVCVCVWRAAAHCCWLSHHTEWCNMYILKQQQQQDYTRCGCRHVAVAGGMALGELRIRPNIQLLVCGCDYS